MAQIAIFPAIVTSSFVTGIFESGIYMHNGGILGSTVGVHTAICGFTFSELLFVISTEGVVDFGYL